MQDYVAHSGLLRAFSPLPGLPVATATHERASHPEVQTQSQVTRHVPPRSWRPAVVPVAAALTRSPPQMGLVDGQMRRDNDVHALQVLELSASLGLTDYS